MQESLYLEAFNHIKPEVCFFVLANDARGKTNIMPAAWSMKCSHEPPLYAICLSKHSYTHKLIRESKQFVLAFPGKDLEKHVVPFGSKHGDQHDKLADSGLATAPAKKIAVPLVKDAPINFECELVQEFDTGDHVIFVGKIVATHMIHGKKILFNMRPMQGQHNFEEF